MGLRVKILIGYGGTLILVAAVMVWAVSGLFRLGKASDAILRENYRSILAAENMVDALERQDSAVLLALLGDRQGGTRQFMEGESLFLQWLARAKDNITIEGEKELLLAIESGFSRYRTLFPKAGESAGLTDEEIPSLSDYHDNLFPVFSSVRDSCIKLRELNEKTMYAASIRAGEVSRRAVLSTVAVGASALIAGLVLSLLLSAKIARPLTLFMEASRDIASGDYSVRVPVQTRDELGLLAAEFNRMAGELARFNETNIDRVLSEKRKGDAVLATIEDGVVVLDSDLHVTGINPAARRILDLTPEDAIGLPCNELLPEPRFCELIRKELSGDSPGTLREEERLITIPDQGKDHHYVVSVTSIRSRSREISGTVLLLKDVTRLKEVERLKSEFIMAASHELRNPLTSLAMSLDLLMERTQETLKEKDRPLLAAAHEEVHRLSAMVGDLLDLSRIEAGRIELTFSGVQVAPLVEHVRSIFKSQAENQSVSLTARLAEDLPPIRADANKVTWVLTNLISNALRYVKQGGSIEVSGGLMGEHVRLSVKDDGPGIPTEYQTRIFQKFVQVQGRESTGTGLGLAICKEIVRAHGGTIWVESEPGRGSVFSFTVPVSRQESRHGEPKPFDRG
ncbi:MAG: ATP-binding protein [Thermodesulfobacteriota bacterium]